MQLDEHLRQVHEHLASVAALGDERTQQIARSLAATADPAVRLAIMGALAAAAEEVTAALLDEPGAPAVSLRLEGSDVRIEVTHAAAPEPDPSVARQGEDGDASARISLRLSESLKAEVESAAGRDGVSVNSWLIRAATAALNPAWAGARSSVPGATSTWTETAGRGAKQAQRITGWING